MEMTVLRVLMAAIAPWPFALAGTFAHAAGDADAGTPAAEAAGITYPSLDLLGFADAGFSASDGASATSNSGFFQGQFVLHFTSELSPRIAFFGEVSVTTSGAYGGQPGD